MSGLAKAARGHGHNRGQGRLGKSAAEPPRIAGLFWAQGKWRLTVLEFQPELLQEPSNEERFRQRENGGQMQTRLACMHGTSEWGSMRGHSPGDRTHQVIGFAKARAGPSDFWTTNQH